MPFDNETKERQALLNKLVSRAVELLKESDNPRQEMSWAEENLWEANLLDRPAPKYWNDPKMWANLVLEQNQSIQSESLPWMRERGTDPSEAETFEQLILGLIPQESGL